MTLSLLGPALEPGRIRHFAGGFTLDLPVVPRSRALPGLGVGHGLVVWTWLLQALAWRRVAGWLRPVVPFGSAPHGAPQATPPARYDARYDPSIGKVTWKPRQVSGSLRADGSREPCTPDLR